ncbi:MAG: type II toxin-antitoxin system VapC family toxin [Treponema sp.]|nr:type II toxin-antitoxin system VapC family toxin [Treponema sp.]
MNYLLDTNVISEIQKSNCNQNVKSFMEIIPWENLYLSVLTIGELCYGVERLPHDKKKHDLSIWLYTELPQWFNRRIIDLDTEVLTEWGKLRVRAGRTLPAVDSLIAACSIVNHMFLVTRNTKDFDDIQGINLINPWEF